MSGEHLRRHLEVHRLDKPLRTSAHLAGLRCFVLLTSGRLYLHTSENNQIAAGPVFLSSAPEGVSGIKNDASSRGWLLAIDPGLAENLLSPFLEATASGAFLPAAGYRSIALGRQSAEAAMSPFEHIGKEAEDRMPGWRESTILLLGRAIIGMSRSLAEVITTDAQRVDVEDLPRYIADNYTDHFSLNDLSALCGTVPGQLSRNFKDLVGRPLFSYINDIRVEKACGLLKRTAMSVTEISFAVGYNNVSFFNRYFRKLMGLSPTEYRNNSEK